MKKRRAELEAQLAEESSKSGASPVTPDKPTSRGQSTPSKTGSVPDTDQDSEDVSPIGPDQPMAEHVGLEHQTLSPIRAIPREGWGNGEDHENYSSPPKSPGETPSLEDMYPDISPEEHSEEVQAWICHKCFQFF